MKSLFLVVTVIFATCSIDKQKPENIHNENQHPKENEKKLAKSLNNFLSLNSISSFALSIDIDTVNFIEHTAFNKVKNYYSRKYWFNSGYFSGEENYEYSKIFESTFLTYFNYLRKKPIFIEHIGTPYIRYLKMPVEVKTNLDKKGVNTEGLRFQKFGDKYYFIDRLNTLRVSVYDPKLDLLEHLNIEDDYFSITDFFLFDLKGDSRPEVFIFSKGRRASDDAIGFDVYTIEDSNVFK